MMLFAQAVPIAQWAVILIVIAGVIGIAMVVLRQAGIVIPEFIVMILWICLAVVVGVLAIRFIMTYL